MTSPRRQFVFAAALAAGLLAGTAAHAFTVEPLTSSSVRAALAEPESGFTTQHNADGSVTTRLGNGTLTFGAMAGPGPGMAPGYPGLSPLPWQGPMPFPPPDGNVRR